MLDLFLGRYVSNVYMPSEVANINLILTLLVVGAVGFLIWHIIFNQPDEKKKLNTDDDDDDDYDYNTPSPSPSPSPAPSPDTA